MLRKIKKLFDEDFFLSHIVLFFIINSLPSLFYFTSIFFLSFYRWKSFPFSRRLHNDFTCEHFFLLPERCSLATPTTKFPSIPSEKSLIFLSRAIFLSIFCFKSRARIKEQFSSCIEIFIKDFSLRIDLQKSTQKFSHNALIFSSPLSQRFVMSREIFWNCVIFHS